MTFKDMNLSIENPETKEVYISGDLKLSVRQYLPILEKTNFIDFVVQGALDDNTGCFSPLRTEVYFALAMCRWYAGIDFDLEDLQNIQTVYDILELNKVTEKIINTIPIEEYNYISRLIEETTKDIARYNSSAAGIISSMSVNADNLNDKLSDILSKVKNKEGLEVLSEIRNVVGKD